MWSDTQLWEALRDAPGDAAGHLKQLIENVLPRIESVLDHGDTMPGNFTLHDSGHSFRVAEWIARLAQDQLTSLSPQDIAMLLLSAYTHDIGMTPPLGRVKSSYTLLLTGDRGAMGEHEINELQAWLDNEWNGLTPPLARGTPTPETLRLADQIIASYVRHRHNDWSEQWIRESLAGAAENMYPTWLDDLVRLCKSHHFDIDQLKTQDFAPRPVGSPPEILHLRYCACLLRVADVLDFDPERTPAVLFSHRDVGGESAIFWHKDHQLSFVQDGNHLSLYAEPADAITHRAIALTVDAVNRELAGCRRLADETHFQRMPNRDADLPYHWTLDTSVKASITPHENAYEYIDGTFRPDPKRLLEMVGGIELYGSAFATVRELLQNAFDAVREQKARERLLGPNPDDEDEASRLANLHRVSLRLEPDADGLRLVCADTGTGMSREVICRRFLIGGTSPSHDIRALERACEEHGFRVGRTARFGIGVLSYFLLGSHLEVRTRRSQEAGDPDATGWIFTSGGLEDFGELRRDSKATAGSEVTLTLRADVVKGDPRKFAEELRAYLFRTVRRLPCVFRFEAAEHADLSFSSPPGWLDRGDEITELMIEPLKRESPEPVDVDEGAVEPESARRARKRTDRQLAKLRARAQEALEVETVYLELPEGLGVARLMIGVFETPYGPSAAFLDVDPETKGCRSLRRVNGLDGSVADGALQMSWNGMSLRAQREDGDFRRHFGSTAGAMVEIDWMSDAAGRLAVHRNGFVPSELANEVIRGVFEELDDLRFELTVKDADQLLALLNARLMNLQPEDSDSYGWLNSSGGDERALAEVSLPVVSFCGDRHEDLDLGGAMWRGSSVQILPRIHVLGAGMRWIGTSWHSATFEPTAVGGAEIAGELEPVAIWQEFRLHEPNESFVPIAPFPPEWPTLLEIGLEDWLWGIYNANHPLVRALDRDDWNWVLETFRRSNDPLGHADELFTSPGKAAAWLARCVNEEEDDLWAWLVEHEPDFLSKVWQTVDGLAELGEIVYWNGDDEVQHLLVVTPTSWNFYSSRDDKQEFARRFPVPGPDWRLTAFD